MEATAGCVAHLCSSHRLVFVYDGLERLEPNKLQQIETTH